MQDIYNYFTETNHVSRVYSVAVILYLQFVLHVMFISHVNCVSYFYISTSWSMCAVPNMDGFCSSLISCFPGVLLRYCSNNFDMVPVAPVLLLVLLLSLHSTCAKFLLWGFYILESSFLITFLSPDNSPSIYIHVPFPLLRITISGFDYYYYYYYSYYYHHHLHPHSHHRPECLGRNCVHCSTICCFLSSVAASTSVRWEEVRFMLPFHPCPVTIQLWSKKPVSWFRRLVASFLGPTPIPG